MYTSLFSAEVQAVFDQACRASGQTNGAFPSPADWRDHSIYFLLVDRFNNPSAPPAHAPYDDPHYDCFQGGTFRGIRQRLDYIKNLGVGAIWLSPVLKNLPFSDTTYHGYGIHDFLRAEPRFADNPNQADDELRALVDAAHQAGLYVIFDIVLNHTGNVFAYNGNTTAPHSNTPLPIQWRDAEGIPQANYSDVSTIANPSADAFVWPTELQNNAYFRRQGGPDPKGPDTLGDFSALKQLMTDNPELQNYLIRAYQYVIARYDIDGFRIDTLRYLPADFALTFGNAVREFALAIGKKNFFTFGEVWDGNAENDIARFIGRNTKMGNDANSLIGVDAALDYPLFNTLKPVIKGSQAPSTVTAMYQWRKQSEQFILSSHGDATRYFVTFLDNHDVKERLRYANPNNPDRYNDQATLGLACLYALPGIPCVYYGTEQGLHGVGSDAAVREALWGIAPQFPQNGLFYTELKKLAAVRASLPALRYGRFYFRPISGDGKNFAVSALPNGVLAWSRILNDREILVIANTSTTQTVNVYAIVDMSLSRTGDQMTICYSNKPHPQAPNPVARFGAVTVSEVDGPTGKGPINAVRVTLQAMEIQILQI